MTKSTLHGVRLLCAALCLALTALALAPATSNAAGEAITLTPSTGVAGSSFTVKGSGFTTSTVYVYFNGSLLGTAATSAGNVNATFQVPNLAAHAYSVQVYTPSGPTAGFSQSASYTITGASSTLGNLALTKYVQTTSGYVPCASGAGCTVQNGSGSTITYAIQYQNTANAGISQLTITDTISAGQSFVNASTGCVPGPPASGTGLVTVTCTVNNVPASPLTGSVNSVAIVTQPIASFTGVVSNQACATEAGFVGQACSNTTYVTVGGSTGTVNTLQLCGTITAYTAPSVYGNTSGSITIAGHTFAIAPNAQITGVAFGLAAPNNNVCIQFTFTNSTATALNVTSNLAAVTVICGVLTTFNTGSFMVGGISYPASSSVFLGNTFVSGGTYCFLIQNNTIVGVLTGIPTVAHATTQSGYHYNVAIPS